ncbi:hypothetical protein RhiirC2_787358 [Rhizophagus irregularis]|uniref:Uncharacterized protein n=1 Tax=Rhizophagus irregularis TaxID=588596 RepID=A0A2N1MSF4_9GLOM|nr:hypothetical protein RhiirC2_787358 [Rhizophagus irregularis]
MTLVQNINLVIQQCIPLPKSIEKGCKYMDDMDLPNLTYVKTCIMNYNNNEYYFHHWSLINCVDEERVYSEQNTGTWWENVEKSILNIKSQLHSIYMSIGNIKNWRHNEPDAKQLLGYLLILQPSDNTEKSSENFKNAARKTFHNSLKVLLEPLLSSTSINMTLNNEIIQFYP